MLCGENVLLTYTVCVQEKKKPSVAFQCVVDPSNLIHNCSRLIHGAECDIQICRNDPYTKKFIEGVYENVKYHILTGIGVAREVQGGYLICDGGYPKYNCFICPLHKRVDRQSVIFSEWLESSRKDVECTFGQLKNRFRILKKPLEMSDELEIEMLFKSCCVLHNMIYDHRDLEY